MWQRRIRRPGRDSDVTVPVDLIVPSEIAPKEGRRGARLPGGHGKTSARKIRGVEGALLDHDHLEVTALEPDDARRIVVKVAGPAALLVAKAHKLGERLDDARRLQSKYAGDVYLLMESTPAGTMAIQVRRLLTNQTTMSVTEQSREYLRRLFAAPRSRGTRLAVQALSGALPATQATTTITEYTRQLLDLTRPSGGLVDVLPDE